MKRFKAYLNRKQIKENKYKVTVASIVVLAILASVLTISINWLNQTNLENNSYSRNSLSYPSYTSLPVDREHISYNYLPESYPESNPVVNNNNASEQLEIRSKVTREEINWLTTVSGKFTLLNQDGTLGDRVISEHMVIGYEVSDNNDYILFNAYDKNGDSGYSSSGLNRPNGLYLYRTETGETTRLHSKVFADAYDMSPSGKYVIYQIAHTANSYIYYTQTGEKTEYAGLTTYGVNITWNDNENIVALNEDSYRSDITYIQRESEKFGDIKIAEVRTDSSNPKLLAIKNNHLLYVDETVNNAKLNSYNIENKEINTIKPLEYIIIVKEGIEMKHSSVHIMSNDYLVEIKDNYKKFIKQRINDDLTFEKVGEINISDRDADSIKFLWYPNHIMSDSFVDFERYIIGRTESQSSVDGTYFTNHYNSIIIDTETSKVYNIQRIINPNVPFATCRLAVSDTPEHFIISHDYEGYSCGLSQQSTTIDKDTMDFKFLRNK